MKAAVIERPDVLTVMEVPDPQISGEYDVLCENLYGAACTGTDLHAIDGSFPFLSPFPTILGHESIGRVVKTGSKVRYLKTGDLVTRVCCPQVGDYSITFGGFAGLGIAKDWLAMREDGLPEEEWAGARVNRVLPEGMDPAAATMIITWRETLSYLTRMGLTQGKTILIVGSGGNGLAFAAHAANLGAADIVMTGSLNREGAGKKAGVTEFFDYRTEKLKELIRDRYKRGFDFFIDAVGKEGMAGFGLSLLKPGGVLGIYGLDDFGKCTLTPLNSNGTFTFYNGGYEEGEAHDSVIKFIQSGKLNASVWLGADKPYPFEKIKNAYEAVKSRGKIKTVVKIKE